MRHKIATETAGFPTVSPLIILGDTRLAAENSQRLNQRYYLPVLNLVQARVITRSIFGD